jgi:signal peptidase
MTARTGVLAALTALRQSVLAACAGLIVCSVAPVALGWTTTVVMSGSMTPAVLTGDVVAASPVAPDQVRRLPPGTVVLVEDPAAPGTLLLHRLMGVTPDGKLITKGDANAVADSNPVPTEALRGQARLRIPALGLPVVWVRDGRYAPVVALGILTFGMLPGAHAGSPVMRPNRRRSRRHPTRAVATLTTRTRSRSVGP